MQYDTAKLFCSSYLLHSNNFVLSFNSCLYVLFDKISLSLGQRVFGFETLILGCKKSPVCGNWAQGFSSWSCGFCSSDG